MKIKVPGDTPMDRLIALTKRVSAVPKGEIDGKAREYARKRAKRRRKQTTP
jgi:hypothetical protein